jgi:hypothetical protein
MIVGGCGSVNLPAHSIGPYREIADVYQEGRKRKKDNTS